MSRLLDEDPQGSKISTRKAKNSVKWTGALQDVGAAAGEGEGADRERQQQQDHLDRIEAELDLAIDHQADHEDRRDGEADRRQRGAEQNVDRPLQPVGECCPHRADPFGRQDQDRDDEPAERGRRLHRLDPMVDECRQLLRQQHDGKHGQDQQDRMIGHREDLVMAMLMRALVVGQRVVGLRLAANARLDELVLVAHGLDHQENAVENHRHRGEEDGLRARELGQVGRDRENRQDQGQDRERNQHRKESLGALQVVVLLAIA